MKNWYIVQTYSSFEKKVASTIKENAVKNKIEDKIEDILVLKNINLNSNKLIFPSLF